MSSIKVLPKDVADQIAAGEVVDRPSSIVRELVENSIDAGADRVVVELENGGKRLVKVSDNGCGLTREDLLLSIERHATSKIHEASDLFAIRSLGFRGEALPSIASVSRLKILSRPAEELVGHRLTVEDGGTPHIEESGAPAGTIVEVRDLFHSVAARRKFLRADRTETDHILDTVFRISLAYPQIGFKLDQAGRNLMNLPASQEQVPRLAVLMGNPVARSMVKVDEQNEAVAIHAYLAPPEYARSRGDRLFVYVNGRNMRDRMITKAVMQGYGRRLMKGAYPQAVLFLEVEPTDVDVNVHPAKQEIRFHRVQPVFEMIAGCINRALSENFRMLDGVRPEERIDDTSMHTRIAESETSYDARPSEVLSEKKASGEQVAMEEGPQVIGQLGNSYILCEDAKGLLMVDQHAAHERILYENLRKGIETSELEVQALLMPLRVELPAREGRVLAEGCAHLKGLGIEVEHFGGNTFLLRSVPALLSDVDWQAFFSELASDIQKNEWEDEELLLDRVLTLMACHGAIRAGQRMRHEEMSWLLRQLAGMDLPSNCPHGRPIFKHFGYQEIEKMFKRIV